MLGTAEDLEDLTAVLVVAPPFVDDDWMTYCRYLSQMNDRVGQEPQRPPILLQVVEEGVPLPSPRARRLVADLRGRVHPQAVSALVTRSTPLRLAGTALDWLRKPHYTSAWFDDVPNAVRFLERHGQRRLPRISTLFIEARMKSRRA